jgi:hypothetical protein
MSSILRVQWTIIPSTPPKPWLACSRCRDIRPFRCSEKFRLNANGKRLDAWLIYRCGYCDHTWNRPVLGRRSRHDIDPAFLHALETNDPQWIRRYAFDVASLRSRTERIEELIDFDVRKRLLSAGSKPFSKLEIRLAVSVPTNLRTDRLLASELGLPRKRIGSLALAGASALRKSVRDGLQIVFDLGAVPDGEAIAQAAGAGLEMDEC